MKPRFAIAATVAALFAVAPSRASAEGWTFDIHEELVLGVGAAIDAPVGLDSRPQVGARVGGFFTSEDGHGVALQLGFVGDTSGDRTPGFLYFMADVLYVFRTSAGYHELVTIGLGPSIGFSDAYYSECAESNPCTPEELDAKAFYDGYDSIVTGGALVLAFDHGIGDEPEKGLYLGVVLDGRILHAPDAPEEQGARIRISGSVGLRFGGRFDL
jgi:hypothetical protein